MARIVFEPIPIELGLYREQYDALLVELEAEGHEVVIVTPTEQRSLPLGDIAFVYDLVVKVGEVAGSLVSISALVAAINKHLPGRRPNQGGPRTRRGEIQLPSGETHTWEMPEE